jgi:hypothetical protein
MSRLEAFLPPPNADGLALLCSMRAHPSEARVEHSHSHRRPERERSAASLEPTIYDLYWRSGSVCQRKRRVLVYIGVGTLVIILIIVLIVYFLRRA